LKCRENYKKNAQLITLLSKVQFSIKKPNNLSEITLEYEEFILNL